MTQVRFLHQLRFDLLSMRRNRRAQFFILVLPVLLLVTFAGLFGLAVLTSSFMALAMAVISQREAGILKRRRATPVPAAVLVASRALTATVASVAACALLVLVADKGFGIHTPPGGLGPALLAVLAGSLCFACCGYAIAATVANAESAQPLLQAVLLPLQMVSGIYFPMSQLPDWLAHVANVFPLAHLTTALQHAWLPSGAEIAWGDLAVMALWAAGAALVAARRFR
jgi:ABC-2 type transport system permease protein